MHGLASIELRKATIRLPGKIREILENLAINDNRGEAKTWQKLASIDLKEGNYDEASENFKKAMKIRQQIGDRDGEASNWHELGMIDLKKGDYDAAQEKVRRGLLRKIMQKIGNLGKLPAWHNLATINDMKERVTTRRPEKSSRRP